MSDERDWSDLPLELIHLISKKLPDLCDFIRFRAVCKTWYSSGPLSDAPPQFPWLLECGNILKRFTGTPLEEGLRFYSLATGETGTIPIQEPHHGKLYRGPCSDYLLILDDHSDQLLSLFNPLTNKAISLPPAPFTSDPNDMAHTPIWTGLDPIQNRHIVFIGHKPRPRNNPRDCWAVYHPDKREWISDEGFFYNGCYWDGMFFTTDGDHHSTMVFDATTKKELYKVPPPKNDHDKISFLVESSGVILRVFRDPYWNEDAWDEYLFHIYRLNFDGRKGQACWVKVSNIGDQVLFLDVMNGFSMKAPAGFKENCIYFLSLRGAPFMFDIAAGTLKMVPCPFESCTWFVPSLL